MGRSPSKFGEDSLKRSKRINLESNSSPTEVETSISLLKADKEHKVAKGKRDKKSRSLKSKEMSLTWQEALLTLLCRTWSASSKRLTC